MFHYIDRSVLGIVIEPVKVEFQLTDTQLGLLTGVAYSIPFALFVIPVGMLADRVNRSRLLAAILFIWSAMTAACGLAASFISLLVARASVGASESAASPICMALVAEYFPSRKRSTPIGIFFLSGSFGTILAFGIGGWVVEEYGWRNAFLFAGIPGMAYALVLPLILKDPRGRPVRVQASNRNALGELISMPGRGAYAHLVMGNCLSTAVVSGIFSWATSFFIREHAFNVKEAGTIVALGIGIAGGIGAVASGSIADRMDHSRIPLLQMPVATCPLFILLLVGFAFSGSTVLSIVLFALWCAISHFFWPPAFNALMVIAPEHRRSTALSVAQLAFNLVGYGSGSLFIGVVSDASGSLRLAIGSIGMLSLWAMGHYFVASRGFEALKANRG